MQNVTGTPDFPRSAELATEMWARKNKERVDGVAAIDPSALSTLLRATGPVRLASGQRLDSNQRRQGAAQRRRTSTFPTNEQQDAFFGRAASAIFDHFIDGDVQTLTAMDLLAETTDQGRFMFWSNHRNEQSVLAGTRLSGELEACGTA